MIRQYNGVVRRIADARQLNLAQTARLAAMVNVVGADAGIAVMYAKYHYLFWRPVSAIDPTAVAPDGFGPVPGYDDGNPATVEQAGWRPLLATPNHPEYPAAHGSLTGAMADVFTAFLGSSQINLDVHGFDPNGPAGNLNAVRALQHGRRPPNRDRQRARLGRRPLPLLRRRRGHPRHEGRRLRPRARLPTDWLDPASAASARARRSAWPRLGPSMIRLSSPRIKVTLHLPGFVISEHGDRRRCSKPPRLPNEPVLGLLSRLPAYGLTDRRGPRAPR